MDAEVERIRALERIFVAACITIFGIVCIIFGLDHFVVAVVAGVLGAVLGRRIHLPKWLAESS